MTTVETYNKLTDTGPRGLIGGAAAVPAGPQAEHLISSSCGGPAGAAYVSDSGWDGFSAIDTARAVVIWL